MATSKPKPEPSSAEVQAIEAKEKAQAAADEAAKEAELAAGKAAAAARTEAERDKAKAPPQTSGVPKLGAQVLPPGARPGDIKAICLKTEPMCRMGGRHYNLKAGEELHMNPSHAQELEQNGWVLRRG